MVVNRVAGWHCLSLKAAAGQGAFAAASAPGMAASDYCDRVWGDVDSAITSFSLTQLLSKAGQRLIAEMRRQVQRHVGLLSVATTTKPHGQLVSRIMTDVEACATWWHGW